MATDKKALKLYIEEQRRYHDELTTAYTSVRTKMVTYIGAGLAFLAFLYAGALDTTKTTLERLFIPDELYGKVFYVFGLFLVLYALGKLIHGSRPNGVWTVAVDSKDVSAIENMSEEGYLIKLKNGYEDARKDNIVQYNYHHSSFKDAFHPLILGAIILIVLRYFQ
jgi:hypothetical protein